MAALSWEMTLYSGDFIAPGTPAGVAMRMPLFRLLTVDTKKTFNHLVQAVKSLFLYSHL